MSMKKKSNGFLEKYYEDCKNKKYIVGEEIIKELENLIEDFNYYDYDTTEADKRIFFIENCLKLTKSPYYGKSFKLLDFQKAFISAMYGFKMPDGTDRFQRAILLIARKNGKSELTSALALTEMLIGGKGLDIVCSSNDDIQASILTDAIDTMRTLIDPKNEDTWRNQKGLKCLINNNKVFKLSDKTKNKEGRNIDFAIIDEVHEMKEPIIVKSIEQSQSLKINPKLILITTEGFVFDGFLDNELKRARSILNKEVEDEASKRYLIFLFTQDSEQEVWDGNRENRFWEKSNPSLGMIKKYDYLEQQIALARQSKSDRVFVLSKDFNIKQTTAEAWLREEDFNYNTNLVSLEDFRDCIYLGGVDIAETTDLTSLKVLLMKQGDPRKYIHSMYFIPQSKIEKLADMDAGARYKEWANKGLIRIMEGNYLNASVVADYYYELYKKYHMRPFMIGYDNKFSNEFINKMDNYGFDYEVIWQRPETMSLPINMVEADLKSRVIIGLNEIDKWCLKNSTIKLNSFGYGILDKPRGQNSKKIDGAVSLCIAYEVFRRYETSFRSNLK